LSAPARRDAQFIALAIEKALREEGITRATHPRTWRAFYLLVTSIEGFAIQDVPQVEVALAWVRDLLEGRVVAITEETR
jgi:hypothetical protein